MSKIHISSKVILGSGHKIDRGAILGYRLNRRIPEDDRLVIGKRATVRSGTVIYLGSVIGNNLETGHNAVIREQNRIGDNFSIWNNSTVDYGCKIGHNVKIHCNCYIAQFTTIEDDCFFAPGVIIANDIHPGCKFHKQCMRGPLIKKGVQIGVNSTILPFIVIGERALIGAGSVVTKDIPAGAIVYGNPAKVKGSIYGLKCISKITDRPYRKEKWIRE
ncbi:MAG: acyltransferase [Candidatus Omnitrophica bacterium]|nr:acyltransferase [Candidatus Omnitrophota bacterium]MDD5591976.1 acyltransferase [Candidatus Omnitrophota bacterium]